MDEDENVVSLQDEDGNDVNFEHIMTFDFEGGYYVALTPETEIDGIQNGDVILLEIVENEHGSDCYMPIEDEDKMNRAWDEFEKLYYEEEEEYEEDEESDGDEGREQD